MKMERVVEAVLAMDLAKGQAYNHQQGEAHAA
jgi:hypothetical protein